MFISEFNRLTTCLLTVYAQDRVIVMIVHLVGHPSEHCASLCQGDLLGLLPGRETFVIDKAGKVVLAFNNQVRATLHSKAPRLLHPGVTPACPVVPLPCLW